MEGELLLFSKRINAEEIRMNKEELQEIRCLRAVLERILRVMDEGLFVDYQMEKFGKIGYKKKFKKIVK